MTAKFCEHPSLMRRMVTAAPVPARLAAAQAGDAQALCELVEPYRAELLAHCLPLLAPSRTPRHGAGTCLRAWKGLGRFSGGRTFAPGCTRLPPLCLTPWMRARAGC